MGRFWGFILVLLLWMGCGGNAPSSNAPTSKIEADSSQTGVQLSSGEKEFLNLLNALRAESGVNPLVLDQTLLAASAHHSLYMASKSTLTHSEPKPNASAEDRIMNLGGSFSFSGENIALGATDGTSLFDQWYSSPAHRDNMLSEKYQFIGISDNEGYWTADFGGN
jgi:uncharacterized protein YkwD